MAITPTTNNQQIAETKQRAFQSDVEVRVIQSNISGVSAPGSGTGGGGSTGDVVFPNVDFVATYETARGTAPGSGGVVNPPPASQISMQLTSPTNFNGATLSDLNALSNDLSVNGLMSVSGGGTEYIGLHSMDAGGGGWHDRHSVSNPTTLIDGPTVDGFNIGILTTSNSNDGLQYGGLSRATSLNETFTIKIRVGGVPGSDFTWANGARISLRMSDGSNLLIAHALNLNPSTTDANWVFENDPWINAAAVLVNKSHSSINNWQEVVFNWTNLAGHPTLLEPGIAGFIDLVAPQQYSIAIHGMQVVSGIFDKNWVAINNTSQTLGANTDFNLGGSLDTMLKGSASSLIIEIGPHQESIIYPAGHIVTHNSTQEDPVIDIDGMTSIVGPSGNKAVCGTGGFLGICRLGVTRDSTGYSLCMNGGNVKNVSSVLTFQNAIKLFKNKTGVIRSIEVWNSRITDQQLQAGTEVLGRTYPQLPTNVLNFISATQTFIDDFTTNTIRRRKSQYDPTIAPITYNPGLGFYNLTAQYDTIGNWMPRLPNFVNSAIGTGRDNVNSEYQEFLDPQYPGNFNPFDWGVQTASCLTITSMKTTSLTAAQQTLVENRFVNGQDTGTKYPYVSGCISSWGKFEQKFGYFEARIKMPAAADGSAASKIWPQFWFLPNDGGNRIEFDVVELIGNGALGHDSNTYHVNSYGVNLGGLMPTSHPYNLGNDFHTFGMLWTSTYIEMYRDGKMYSHYDIASTQNTNDLPAFPIFNIAVGGTAPGIPSATTDSSMPALMLIDYFRAFRLS